MDTIQHDALTEALNDRVLAATNANREERHQCGDAERELHARARGRHRHRASHDPWNEDSAQRPAAITIDDIRPTCEGNRAAPTAIMLGNIGP